MAEHADATILHADLDAFYASVEQLLDPRLAGRPLAVGGGVVLAASYEAKAHGVTGGMPTRRARELCPGLLVVAGRFADYQGIADRVVAIMGEFTPAIERISIDEAFLDVAGATRLFGNPARIAEALRRRVRDEVGLPISVGVATTKHLAKVASQVAKPDGLLVVEPGTEAEFLAPLPVELLWGVGPVTRARLADSGITTIGQLAATDPAILTHLLGRVAGGKLGALAANADPRVVAGRRRARSVGAQSALGRRRVTPELLSVTLGHLADRVATRLRAARRAGRTVTVRVRYADLSAVTRSRTLAEPVDATRTITEIATELVEAALADRGGTTEVSLLAISVSGLAGEPSAQLELPFVEDGELDPRRPGTVAGSHRRALDQAVDAVRSRFGREAVGVAAVSLASASRVPDTFRELAERDLGE